MAKDVDARPAKRTHCPLCRSKDQGQRHIHFLQFPGEDAMVGHLREQYDEAEWNRLQLDGTIGALVSWRRTIIATYGHLVGADGAPLPVWKAWVLSQQGESLSSRRSIP